MVGVHSAQCSMQGQAGHELKPRDVILFELNTRIMWGYHAYVTVASHAITFALTLLNRTNNTTLLLWQNKTLGPVTRSEKW